LRERFTREELVEFARLGGLANKGKTKRTRVYLSNADKQKAYRLRKAKARCELLNQNKQGLVFVINPKSGRIVKFRNVSPNE
jgi:hypothetical protein